MKLKELLKQFDGKFVTCYKEKGKTYYCHSCTKGIKGFISLTYKEAKEYWYCKGLTDAGKTIELIRKEAVSDCVENIKDWFGKDHAITKEIIKGLTNLKQGGKNE